MYFTSDLHFFHENILKWSKRPYKTIEEMNNNIIDTINKRVGQVGVLYILGDVSFGNLINTVDCLQRIHTPNKILIVGNHDEHFLKKQDFTDCFKEVHHRLQLNVNKRVIILDHYPIQSWKNMHHGSIHLHGHSHGGTDNTNLNRIDVGFDVYPNILHINEVFDIIKSKEPQEETP